MPADDQDGQEDRAAVDEQEDHEDDAHGGDEQTAVDALEGGREVGELTARPRHIARQALGACCRGHVLDDAGQRLERRVVARQGEHHLHGPAVLARDGRRRRTRDAVDLAEPLDGGGDRLEVALREPRPAFPHDEGGDVLVTGEAGLELQGPGRLGRVGQERRLVVLGDAAQLPGQRAGHRGDDEEDDEQHGGGQDDAPPADASTSWLARAPVVAETSAVLDRRFPARHLAVLPRPVGPPCLLIRVGRENSSDPTREIPRLPGLRRRPRR